MVKHQYFCGFSILEVLIATVILAVGLLGITGLFIHSFKRVKDSYLHTVAISQFMVMAETKNVFGHDVSSWKKGCKYLLPHGKCNSKNDKITVCWGIKQYRQCLK